MDAGTVAEADELDFAKLELDVVEEWVARVMALADAVTDNGVVVCTAVEVDGLEVPRGFAESIDVGVEEEGIRLGVEDAVVDGGTGFDVLDVGGIATGGVLVYGGLAGLDVLDGGGWTTTGEVLVAGGLAGVDVLDGGGGTTTGEVLVGGRFTGGGAVDEVGASPAGDSPPPVTLTTGPTPYTGTLSMHGAEHTAETRAQWVKRMHKMPKGNWTGSCIVLIYVQMSLCWLICLGFNERGRRSGEPSKILFNSFVPGHAS